MINIFVLFMILNFASSDYCRSPHGFVCCPGFSQKKAGEGCTRCKIGFHGPDCQNQCSYPSYGRDCQLTCTCSRELCNLVYGCVNITVQEPFVKGVLGGRLETRTSNFPSTGELVRTLWQNGCTKGFEGSDCAKPCSYPAFGEECQLTCSCSKDNCDHIYGCDKIIEPNTTADVLPPTSSAEQTSDRRKHKEISGVVISVICLTTLAGLLLVLYFGSRVYTIKNNLQRRQLSSFSAA